MTYTKHYTIVVNKWYIKSIVKLNQFSETPNLRQIIYPLCKNSLELSYKGI